MLIQARFRSCVLVATMADPVELAMIPPESAVPAPVIVSPPQIAGVDEYDTVHRICAAIIVSRRNSLEEQGAGTDGCAVDTECSGVG